MRGKVLIMVLLYAVQAQGIVEVKVLRSETYVALEGDLKWKYWPLLQHMNELMLEGEVVPYNDSLSQELEVGKIDSARIYRELVRREDPDYPNEYRTFSVERYKSYADWFNGVVFSIRWWVDATGALQGQVVGVGPSYSLQLQGQDLGTFPAYFLRINDLDQYLSASELAQLKTLFGMNCHRFKAMTRLYSKAKAESSHPDSLFDFDVLKTKAFFRKYPVYYDDSLTRPIEHFKDFEALQHEVDTLGFHRNSKYLWSYGKWLFFDHLVYTVQVSYRADTWRIGLQWQSVGLSGQDRTKQPTAFYMKPESLKDFMAPDHFRQLLRDFSEGALLGFEHSLEE